jgi:RHS repeat-associated protein
LRLPSGGGAVASIGAGFTTQLNSGTGTYVVPIELPQGYRAQRPQIALQYSTGAGQAELGLGWSLPRLAITRDTRPGAPVYGDGDRFLLGGEELVALGGGRFRPRVDTSFQLAQRLPTGWEVRDRQGTRRRLGSTEASQERNPALPGEAGAAAWFLDEEIDTSGNSTRYSYLRDGGTLYLHRIEYAIYRLELEYEERPDAMVGRRMGFAQQRRWRCRRIALHNLTLQPTIARSYELAYDQDPVAGHSLLAAVELRGHLFASDGMGDADETASAPALRFAYTRFQPEQRRVRRFDSTAGDGPPSLSTSSVDVVDLEGFGLPGLLQADDYAHLYWPNRGDATWGLPRKLRYFPAGVTLGDETSLLCDVDGDGRADLLVSRGALSGYYPGAAGRTWDALRSYRHRRPAFEVHDPHVRWLDADGDGRVDAVQGSGRALLFYRGRGADGWDALPHVVPRRRDDPTYPDVTLDDPRVRFADMTGDGLVDLVRVFRRHVEYWPSLGVGRWDVRHVLRLPGDAPERFDPRRCHLVDVNGDGIADLVYVDDEAIFLWVNRQGNTFAEAVVIRQPPPATPETVRAADMLGTGCAGLVFGQTRRAGMREPYRFVDFVGGVKPYLMSRVDNGVGGVTELSYGTSTAHRLRDRDAGRDWQTFLPRAVSVVDRLVRRDAVTSRSSTVTYAYHDGQYDGRAQRFAGFGSVDQRDDHGAGDPPTVTRHAFHVGLPRPGDDVPADRVVALRGRLLRKEVRADDGTPARDLPFLVQTVDWAVAVVATGADGTPVLLPHPTRNLTEKTERGARVSRVVTELEHDGFGNVVAERRRGTSEGAPAQELEIRASYANDEARWLLGLPTRRTVLAGGAVADDVRLYYDGLDFGLIGTGLMTRRERVAFSAATLGQVFAGVRLPDLAALGYRAVASGPEVEYRFDEQALGYDARGNVVSVRDPYGKEMRIEYDAAHQLFAVRVVNPLGHEHKASYHPRLDAIAAYTGAAGAVTRYAYTPLGQVRREVQPGDSDALPTIAYDYRTAAAPVSTVMRRRRESGTAAVRQSVAFYDGWGNKLQTRARRDDGRWEVTGLERFDGRRVVVERHLGWLSASDGLEASAPTAAWRYRHDALGRVLEVVSPAGERSHAIYDVDSLTFFDLGDDGGVAPYVDTPRVHRTDPFNNLFRVEEQAGPASTVTNYQHDANGRLLRVIDASGSELLAQTFDLAGRKLRVVHRDAGTRRFLYDARGQLAFYVDAAGRTESRSWDDLGRVTEVRLGETVTERFRYDRGEGDNLLSRLAEASDRHGRETFSYDARGRVKRTSRVVTGEAQSFDRACDYDPDGRVVRATWPDGGEVRYAWDALGRLAGISDLVDAVSYDGLGRRAHVSYASGVEERFSWDPVRPQRLNERFLAQGARTLVHDRLSYDASGNVTAIDDLRPPQPGPPQPPSSRTFAWDALDRLVHTTGTWYDRGRGDPHAGGATGDPPDPGAHGNPHDPGTHGDPHGPGTHGDPHGPGTHGNPHDPGAHGDPNDPGAPGDPHTPSGGAYDLAYAYDGLGNFTLNQGWRPEPLWYEGTRLRGFVSSTGPQATHQYDANGCVSRAGGAAYEFDVRESLVRVTRADGVVVELDYDHAGHRLRKRVLHGRGQPGRPTIYLGEDFEVLPNGRQRRFVRDPDGAALLVVEHQQKRVLHSDSFGNVVLVYEHNAHAATEILYQPFGAFSARGPDPSEDVRFAGRPFDADLGLYYFRWRFYDAAIGRFISPDPVAVASAERGLLRPLSLNPYLYALDNPLRYRDANGLWTFWEGFFTVLIVAAVVALTVVTFGWGAAVMLGVGALLGACIGAATHEGSVDAMLAGALLGFGIVATILTGAYLGMVAGAWLAGAGGAAYGMAAGASLGVAQGALMALGYIPSVRQSSTYQDILGIASWFNPWAWPGHAVGATLFIVNAVVYGALFMTMPLYHGDVPSWAQFSVDISHGNIVVTGGAMGSVVDAAGMDALTYGGFTFIRSGYSGDRDSLLRHERGHTLNNAYFGILQAGDLAEAWSDPGDLFFEQLAESGRDTTTSGGRHYGDIPWWNE